MVGLVAKYRSIRNHQLDLGGNSFDQSGKPVCDCSDCKRSSSSKAFLNESSSNPFRWRLSRTSVLIFSKSNLFNASRVSLVRAGESASATGVLTDFSWPAF